jgi:O-antigen/teichoic acid export membrane protein
MASSFPPESGGEVLDAPATARVIGRSFSFRLAAQILSALVNVAGMAVLGNTLAAQGYGEYAFYYALVPLIAALSDLGVGAIVTREIARDRASGPRLFGDALIVKGIVSGLLLLAVLFAAPLTLDPMHRLLVIVVAATALIDFSQDVGVWVFRAHDRQDLEALLLMVSQLVWLAGIVWCAAIHAPLSWFLGTAAAAFLLRTVLGFWIVTRRLYRPVFAPRWDRLRHLAREGLPFGLAMFAVVLYGRAGVLMLKGMATSSEVAFFNVGYMLSQPLGFVSSAFNVSAFPSLSRAWSLGPAAVRPMLRRAVKFQFLAALPLGTGLFLLAPRVVLLLLKGEDFRRAALALEVMSVGMPLIFLNLMSRYVLTAFDRQRAYLTAILVGLVANVALGWLAIPRFGAAGACGALIGGELAVFVVCQRSLAPLLTLSDLIREVARPLAAAAVMGAVVFVLRGANLALVTFLGAVAYVLALLAVRAFSTDELRVLRAVAHSFHIPGTGPRSPSEATETARSVRP